ncbi:MULTISPECIES: DUF4405 domain-containing protein [unclassified Agrobacterium]|uniref:DUF4405 domain-containing protein n=1 Tax=unclassified Agrobacterium TaxID=2632611 RepID=UPI00069B4C13|nr:MULTISPECIES: DUF4405 domain-containing protein [unclassified Agrobacterium]KNY33195.1 hypothetical protein AKG12_15575 [Agrobacterium sp. SUL3]MCD4663347.1 DUF4405 domain-containing protein [Agrobacterium sp.]
MNGVLRFRLILDLIAVGLIVACLAYWWLDNLSHELFGTVLFTLVIVHNVFNRRWYGGVTKRKLDVTRIINLITIVSLAIAMTIMFLTSLLISRDLFPLTAMGGAFAVREIHMFTGYWMLLIVGIHLGTRWQVVMNVFYGMIGMPARSACQTAILRLLTALIMAWGVKSSFDMAFGSKLMLRYSLDMWDFNAATLGFFVNYASIVGLYIAATHFGLRLVSMRARRRMACE